MRLQAQVGHTTYTIEDVPGAPPRVQLSRLNPPRGSKPAEHAVFFVPVSLIVEYVVARMTSGVAKALTQLGEAKP